MKIIKWIIKAIGYIVFYAIMTILLIFFLGVFPVFFMNGVCP